MLLKRGQMVVNAFKSGIFSIASEKSEEESGDLFLSKCYDRLSTSESPTKILLEDVLPRR